MRRLIMSMALLVVIGSPAALAQGGNSGGSSTAVKSQPTPAAPVGHRQPRGGEVPSEKNLSDPNDALARENAALDRKIKSICRGC
jgi:hypothetical protein